MWDQIKTMTKGDVETRTARRNFIESKLSSRCERGALCPRQTHLDVNLHNGKKLGGQSSNLENDNDTLRFVQPTSVSGLALLA